MKGLYLIGDNVQGRIQDSERGISTSAYVEYTMGIRDRQKLFWAVRASIRITIVYCKHTNSITRACIYIPRCTRMAPISISAPIYPYWGRVLKLEFAYSERSPAHIRRRSGVSEQRGTALDTAPDVPLHQYFIASSQLWPTESSYVQLRYIMHRNLCQIQWNLR